MKEFKIAMVQHKIRESDVENNTETAIRYMREAEAAGADLVLFPECFLTAYQFPKICETLQPVDILKTDDEFVRWCGDALDDSSPYLQKIRQAAETLHIGAVITGLTKGEKYPQNTAYIIDRDGSILLKYNKVHTCDFDKERYLESGKEFKVCRFDGICMGVMICYDREYPESARELMLQGAELILIPNDCDCIRPFRLRELSVAAMQNMTGIAMANPPGPDAGCSCAYHPMVWRHRENSIIVADEEIEGLVYASFDIDAIRNYRDAEDLGRFRKIDAYKHLLSQGQI